MKYHYALFDFDGTIVDSVPCIIRAVKETFAHYQFPEPPEAEIRRYIGIPLEKYFPYLGREHYERHDPDEVIGHYRMLYKKYSPTEVTLYDGMFDLLKDLKDSGRKAGIVTSKHTEPLLMNCEQLGITGFFDGMVGSDQVRLFKPLPETVFLCAQKLGVEDIRKALVIGDSPKDIEMGQRAGADTCAVPWGAGTKAELTEEVSPTYYAETMDALRDVLFQDA